MFSLIGEKKAVESMRANAFVLREFGISEFAVHWPEKEWNLLVFFHLYAAQCCTVCLNVCARSMQTR